MFRLKSSLKTRILFTTGLVIVALMLIISVIILIKWRAIIIQKQTENAFSVAKTFSVTVVDALIFEEKSVYQKENILDSYIDNFIRFLGNVKYVTVSDQNGTEITSRFINGYNSADALTSSAAGNAPNTVYITEHKYYGWILQCNLPIELSGKKWGNVSIAFDAQTIRDEISSLFFLLLGATIVLTSFILSILYLLINRLTYSLGQLVSEIDKIDLMTDTSIALPEQNDEIGFLYHHFGLLKKRLDISKAELENAQKQIYQAEKLASIGRLASGVAHQVNNPLNGIKSCLYAIKKDPSNAAQAKEYIELINEGIENIETVVKKLLGFARQQPQSNAVIDINESIEKVVNLFDYRLKDNRISLSLDLADDLSPVKIEYHLFQEVIMNFLLNSFDAIEKEGNIKIRTANTENDKVLIEITDNGSGIDPEIQKKVFDPFFTTKDIGIGTGLGLSVCLGIIESHNGKIELESKIGTGTKFTVYLPVDK
ncbi:MAG: hypothetical protein HUU54_07725 [Ignavibacteriaceae bacterium]|nr:hypothetical protein [Ignavibacteriaceae bacterium]